MRRYRASRAVAGTAPRRPSQREDNALTQGSAAPQVLRTPQAQQDLLDIWAYIAAQNAPSVADRVLQRLVDTLWTLASAPMIGRERSEFPGNPRSFAVRPYLIFYEPLDQGGGILVWRILHGARDLSRLITPP